MPMPRTAIVLFGLVAAGCSAYDGGPGYGGPAYVGGPVYTGGPAYSGPVYAGGYAPGFGGGPPRVGYYGSGGYYGRPPPGGWGGGPGWNGPPPNGGPGLVARQQQYNQQITQQQQNYNTQVVAAQQRYNQQVSANPGGAAVYRDQMNRDTAQAQRQLQNNAGNIRKVWLGN